MLEALIKELQKLVLVGGRSAQRRSLQFQSAQHMYYYYPLVSAMKVETKLKYKM